MNLPALLRIILISLAFGDLAIFAANAQQTPPVVPPEKLGSYCLFNGGVYSVGAVFCAKPGTSLQCKAPDKDRPNAQWEATAPDNGCQLQGH